MSYRHDDDWDDYVKMAIWIIAGTMLFIWVSGCTTAPVKEAAQPSSGYDALVVNALTPALRAAPLGDLCPNGMDAEAFWPALVRATVDVESGGDPRQQYTEKFPDNQGKLQVSQGLMQLSLDDSSRGPHCRAINAVTILEAEPNLLCSIDIMDQLVRANTKGTLRANLGRYWSTIRDGKVDAELVQLLPRCFEGEGK